MTEELARLSGGLLQVFSDPSSRTYWPFLLVTALLAWLLMARGVPVRRTAKLWLHRSSLMDVQLLLVRRLLSLAVVVPRHGRKVAAQI